MDSESEGTSESDASPSPQRTRAAPQRTRPAPQPRPGRRDESKENEEQAHVAAVRSAPRSPRWFTASADAAHEPESGSEASTPPVRQPQWHLDGTDASDESNQEESDVEGPSKDQTVADEAGAAQEAGPSGAEAEQEAQQEAPDSTADGPGAHWVFGEAKDESDQGDESTEPEPAPSPRSPHWTFGRQPGEEGDSDESGSDIGEAGGELDDPLWSWWVRAELPGPSCQSDFLCAVVPTVGRHRQRRLRAAAGVGGAAPVAALASAEPAEEEESKSADAAGARQEQEQEQEQEQDEREAREEAWLDEDTGRRILGSDVWVERPRRKHHARRSRSRSAHRR